MVCVLAEEGNSNRPPIALARLYGFAGHVNMFALSPVAANSTNIEDFESYSSGAFPERWRARSAEAQKICRVGQENGNRFLRAHAHKQAVQIGLEHSFTPQRYTRLGWRWRVLTFPTGADERRAHLHDAAAQVYVVFDNQYWPRIIKYVWSSRNAVGAQFVNPLYVRGWVVVMRTGAADREAWYSEEINFLEDYRKLFSAEPESIQGIGILTSSDSTQSVATADYDDFTLLP